MIYKRRMSTMAQMSCIRIYGDSISMPRFGDGIGYGDSWPMVLQDRLGTLSGVVCNRSIGGATLAQIADLYFNDSFYFRDRAGIVVFRIGIVDCAPRPLSPFARKALGYVPEFIRRRIVRFLHNHREWLLRHKYWLNTPLPVFATKYRRMVEDVVKNNGVAICVGIGPVAKAMQKHSPGLSYEMNRYNRKIAEIAAELKCKYVDMDEILRIEVSRRGLRVEDVLLSDGHHCNVEGNRICGEVICGAVQEILVGDKALKGGV